MSGSLIVASQIPSWVGLERARFNSQSICCSLPSGCRLSDVLW
jgi:hypothetical protein